MLTDLAQYSVYGLTTSGLLLLSTVGFTLVRQVDGFLNIAHAELIAFSAFTGWYLNGKHGWGFLPAACLAVAGTVILALVLQRFVFAPMRSYGPAILLITSVGVAFALQGVIQMMVGGGTFLYELPLPRLIDVGPARVNPYEGDVFLVALGATLVLSVLMTRTRIGRRIRAVSINPSLAENRGVRLQQTSQIAWLMSGLTAGVAGVSLGAVGTLTTDLAFEQILLIVAVAIFAGFGSLLDLVFAAMLTGLGMKLSLLWLPSAYQSAVPFLIILIVLLFRPQGLNLRGRAA
jgi:neutral amino acid transport system permease protein